MVYPHVHGVETDYCNVDGTRCDKDGIYKYKWVTGYQDFIVRDIMDDDLELISTEPDQALNRTMNTLERYPNRERYIFNKN